MPSDLITAKLKTGITDGISIYKDQAAEIDLADFVDLKRITGQSLTYPYTGNPISQDGGVLAGKSVSKISSGENHTIVLNSDGSLAAFGRNLYGQLGNSSTSNSNTPVEVITGGALSLENITRIKCGYDALYATSYALSADGDFFGWGFLSNANSTVASPVYLTAGVLDFAVTGTDYWTHYRVVRKSDGLYYNRRVTSNITEYSLFQSNQVAALSGKTITQLEGSATAVYALCSDGTIFRVASFNDNFSSVTLNGALTGKTVSRLVGGIDRIFAICTDGTIAGLGANTYGKLGNGNAIGQTTWAAVSMTGALAGKTITDVSVGMEHTLFLCSDGTVAAVGRNANGQLGNGTTLNSTTAVKVFAGGHLNGKTPIAVEAGGYHSSVITSDGNLFTWGSDSFGQLGNGSPLANSTMPVPVLKDSFTRYNNHIRFTSVSMPDGLSFDGNLVETANIIGAPTETGTQNALIKIELSDFTLYNPIPASGNLYQVEGTTYLTVPFIVNEAPTSLDPVFTSIIANSDITIGAFENRTIYLMARQNLNWVQWHVESPPPGMDFVEGNRIAGTPNLYGEYEVTIKLSYRTDWSSPLIDEQKTITITVEKGRSEIDLTGLDAPWNGQAYVLSTGMQVGTATNLQIRATNDPESFTATGLPAGLTINNSGLISGTPTAAGIYLLTLTATNNVGTGTSKTLRVNVAAASTAPTPPPVFLENGGVDVFMDLQTRELSLTPPKAEATIASGATVVNSTKDKPLLIKSGEILWLNLRFTKGTKSVDPEPTAMRFGVASKIGGPLLMEGDAFTKVGTGSSAYYKMRVVGVAAEFGALIDDYYDEDAVEQIDAEGKVEASNETDIKGLSELKVTTGTGESISDIRSDTMEVVIKKSLLG
jgi:alpha-tubulin suppressor-like RCC1 family protein